MYQAIIHVLLTIAVIVMVVSLWKAGKQSGARVEIDNEEQYIDIRRN